MIKIFVFLLFLIDIVYAGCDFDVLNWAHTGIIKEFMQKNRPFLLLNMETMSIEDFNRTYYDYDLTHGDRDTLQRGFGGDKRIKVKDMFNQTTQSFTYFSDLDKLRPSIIPPHPFQIISIGGPRSGVGFHNHRRAFFHLYYGTKEWFFYSRDRDIMYEYDRHKKFLRNDVSQEWFEQPIYCVQPAGSIMFVPEHWAHATVNLELTIGIGYQLEEQTF